jgi:hypothetical protein
VQVLAKVPTTKHSQSFTGGILPYMTNTVPGVPACPTWVLPSPLRDHESGRIQGSGRSEPPLGSVIAMAVMIWPEQEPGSQRSFCSLVPRSTRYGATQSAWRRSMRTPRH